MLQLLLLLLLQTMLLQLFHNLRSAKVRSFDRKTQAVTFRLPEAHFRAKNKLLYRVVMQQF